MAEKLDRELQEFRDVMQVPDTFEDGFSWSSLVGAFFVALLMVPGAIYMGLLVGHHAIGPAARWVTVILFLEVAKRAHKNLKKSELFVLFFMAGAAMGLPFGGLLFKQYFVRSDPAIAQNIAQQIPSWWAPAASSDSFATRTFFHIDWLPAIGLTVFATFFSQFQSMVLGYGLFRLTSDVEKLPFPMAPVGAQGITALAQDTEGKQDDQQSWRWRVFSIGGALGLAFGVFYIAIPTITGAITGEPVVIFPIPFVDWTAKTSSWLPAVATGVSLDLGHLITGMVMPFWAMVGSFAGLLVTMVANPILYNAEVLTSWSSGDGYIATRFNNFVDLYFSFSIGLSLAIAIVGFWQVYRNIKNRRRTKQSKEAEEGLVSVEARKDRGDIRWVWVFLTYVVATGLYIVLSGYLIDWHRGVMIVLLVLGFVYTPLIAYVTARLEGMIGQAVAIPFVREASLILSGYRGVACWFLPIPMANYGMMTVFYRQCELTGTKFTSIWKTKLILYPVILASSILFMNFIWSLAPIPSPVYQYADMMWEQQAAQRCVMYGATMGEYTIFEEAFTPKYVAIGTAAGLVLFTAVKGIGAPIFLCYGLVRGLDQTLPHALIPNFIGALIGQFYFRRKFGAKQWRQYIPVVAAGFACGMGLLTTACIGITFLSKAAIQLPF